MGSAYLGLPSKKILDWIQSVQKGNSNQPFEPEPETPTIPVVWGQGRWTIQINQKRYDVDSGDRLDEQTLAYGFNYDASNDQYYTDTFQMPFSRLQINTLYAEINFSGNTAVAPNDVTINTDDSVINIPDCETVLNGVRYVWTTIQLTWIADVIQALDAGTWTLRANYWDWKGTSSIYDEVSFNVDGTYDEQNKCLVFTYNDINIYIANQNATHPVFGNQYALDHLAVYVYKTGNGIYSTRMIGSVRMENSQQIQPGLTISWTI